MENATKSKDLLRIPVNLKDEMAQIICVILEAAKITPEEFVAKLNGAEVQSVKDRILAQLVIVHKKGMRDMKTVYDRGIKK